MLEALVGFVAGLLVVAGIVIMVGPAIARGFSLAGRRRRVRVARPRRGSVPAEIHPTIARAIGLNNQLIGLLKEHGLDRHAGALQHAGRRLEASEEDGIYAMQDALRRMRGVRLGAADDQAIFDGLAGQLRKMLRDRAEQLELLPRG